MNFRVGQKVVYIGDEGIGGCRKGDVYTVSAVREAPDYMGVLRLGLLVAEVDLVAWVRAHFPQRESPNMAMDARCFRPVVEPKTDISVFHELLDKINQGDRELIPG